MNKKSMTNKKTVFRRWIFFFCVLLLAFSLSGCGSLPASVEEILLPPAEEETSALSVEEIPEYAGTPYVEINHNVPEFSETDYQSESFESYSPLDALGRCQTAFANIGENLMPTEERGSIGQVKPAGWHTVKYDIIDGKYLYNRCHLIGFQLTGENANEKNLITGTRYMNTEGMLPFENMVADYIKETGNHVLYRVTPVYTGDNLIADGLQLEASSVEDSGEAIQFNVFVYNVQPGIDIDYSDGSSKLSGEKDDTLASSASDSDAETEIRGNKNSKIYHCPGQRDYEEMADSKNLIVFHSEQEAIDAGYRKAKN